MEKLDLKRKKLPITRDELEKLSKNELIDKIIQINAHNTQLINIINKNSTSSQNESLCKKDQKPYDFSKAHYRHILLRLYYLGWDYKGFACQEDSAETIEHYLFDALIKTCLIKDRNSSNYHRCGRTDKGVSAFCQVISINVRSKFDKNEQNSEESLMNEIEYCKILNKVLPKQIQCIAWCPLQNEEFSARFDCEFRTYKYFFPKSQLNIEAMQKACKYLLGTHDFRNFCKLDVANGVTEYIRNVIDISIDESNECNKNSTYNMFVLKITGKAFLWHQIRCIMSILLLIGEEKEQPEVIKDLLNVDLVTNKPQYVLASDIPLNLYNCQYNIDENQWIYKSDALKYSICCLQQSWCENAVKASMVQTIINDLVKLYNDYCKATDTEKDSNESLYNQHELLLAKESQSKIYQPLLQRKTCESLENRITHFNKKRKTYNSSPA